VRYEHDRWLRRFTRLWPEGSEAHVSYFSRIEGGVGFFDLTQAARLGFDLYEK
jgi:hypothetical protein